MGRAAGPGMIRAMQELRIQQHFIDSADLYYQVSETLAKPVDAAVQALLASVTGGGKVLVDMGIVNHHVLRRFDIEQPVYYAEIDWTELMKATRKNSLLFQELSKYPAVSRDLALLVDANVEFAQIEQIARQTEKKLLKQVVLFDVYQGKNLPEGKKSYAVNFILQDESRTLTDKAIEAIMQKLMKNLTTKLHAELR